MHIEKCITYQYNTISPSSSSNYKKELSIWLIQSVTRTMSRYLKPAVDQLRLFCKVLWSPWKTNVDRVPIYTILHNLWNNQKIVLLREGSVYILLGINNGGIETTRLASFTSICNHWDCIIKLCKYWHTSNKKIGKRDDKNKL